MDSGSGSQRRLGFLSSGWIVIKVVLYGSIDIVCIHLPQPAYEFVSVRGCLTTHCAVGSE